MELQYDGTGLHGWAKQKGLSTVEGSLEEAFRLVLGRAPKLRVAGRTDAGVHARRQVVSLRLPDRTEKTGPSCEVAKTGRASKSTEAAEAGGSAETALAGLRTSLNALTPPGIAVMRIARAPEGFNARRDATSRIYRYYLCTLPVLSPFWRCYCWHLSHPLDMGAMGAAADLVAGRHNFSAFTPVETQHVFFDRLVLRCRWTRVTGGAALLISPGCLQGREEGQERGIFFLEIEAEAFLRHMVRTLVGTMVEVGQGKRSLHEFQQLLQGARREEAGPTAPPHGLFLWDVKYSGVDSPLSPEPLVRKIEASERNEH